MKYWILDQNTMRGNSPVHYFLTPQHPRCLIFQNFCVSQPHSMMKIARILHLDPILGLEDCLHLLCGTPHGATILIHRVRAILSVWVSMLSFNMHKTCSYIVWCFEIEASQLVSAEAHDVKSNPPYEQHYGGSFQSVACCLEGKPNDGTTFLKHSLAKCNIR